MTFCMMILITTNCHLFISKAGKCPFVYMWTVEARSKFTNEPWHDISNSVVCATSKGSDQPAHMRRLIRDFASRLNIL